MTITVSTARAWDTSALDVQSELWSRASETLDDKRSRFTNRVLDSPEFWRGIGGDAMRRTGDGIGSSAGRLVSSLADVSNATRAGSVNIAAARQYVLDCVSDAQRAQFVIADDGSVTVPPDLYLWIAAEAGPEGAAVAKRVLEENAREHERRINEALQNLDQVDRDAASALDAAVGGLRANPILVSGGGDLSGAQGGVDGALISSGEATAADRARIGDALVQAQLTPEQLDAIAQGEAIADMPQKTFDYLSGFYDAVGKDDLLALADQFREQEQAGDPKAGGRLDALANGLLTLSDEKVGTGTESGGYGQVPPSVRELVYHGYEPDPNAERSARDLADIGRLGDLLGEATPGHQPGAELGVEFDRVAAHMADVSNKSGGFIFPMPEGMDYERTTEQFLDIGVRNPDSSWQVLTGLNPDGSPMDFNRDSVLLPLSTHDWPDDGASVGGLVSWINADAVVENPNDPVDVDRATRAGEATFGMTQFLSTTDSGIGGNNFASLINIADPKNPPGDVSIGQLNPIFTQQVAGAVAPYVGDMVGVDEKYTGTRGFGDLGPVEATRVFALLDGDPKAGGIINGAALAQASALDKAFAVGAVNGEDSWSLGYGSGNLHTLVEAGLGAEVVDRNLDGEAADAALRQQRSEAYGVSQWLASGVVSFVPGGAVINPLANSVALMLQDDYVNGAGAAVSATPSYSGESFTTGLGIDNIRMHSMLSALVEDGRVDVNDLNEGLVRDGRLKTLDEMDQDIGSARTAGMIPNALETAGVSGIDRLDYLRAAAGAGVAVSDIIFPDHLDSGKAFSTILVNGVGNQRTDGWPR